jgi:hypothetical protein
MWVDAREVADWTRADNPRNRTVHRRRSARRTRAFHRELVFFGIMPKIENLQS